VRPISLLTAGCALTLVLSACSEPNPTEPPYRGPDLRPGALSSCGVEEQSYVCVRYPNGDSVNINPFGFDDITVAAMNPSGEIAGTFGRAGTFHAFRWSDGVFSILPELEGGTSHATAINPRGQIVGYGDSDGSFGNPHAILWDNGSMTDLGTLGGCCSFADSIDASGQVFGTSVTAEGERHRFSWKNGVMTDLGPA